MSSSDNTITETRRFIQKAQLEELEKLKKQLYTLRQPVFDDTELENLSIRKLPALDTDETAPLDLEPLFFQPYPVSDGDDFQSLAQEALEDEEPRWMNMCNEQGCTSRQCGIWKERWASRTLGSFGTGIRMNTEWDWGTG